MQGSTLQLASPVLAGPASAGPLEVAEIVEVDTPLTEAGGNVSTVTGHGSLTRAAPSNIHQAEAALSQFDWSTLWGASGGHDYLSPATNASPGEGGSPGHLPDGDGSMKYFCAFPLLVINAAGRRE